MNKTKAKKKKLLLLLVILPILLLSVQGLANMQTAKGFTNLVPEYFGPQLATDRIQLPRALGLSRHFNADTITVGVVDQGISYTHPSLAGQIHWGSPHNINTTLHSHNGNPVLNPVVSGNHGTRVAGVLAAMSPYIRIAVLGGGTWIESINFATERGIPILVISRYIPGVTDNPTVRDRLYRAIRDFPGLIVVSANNYNVNGNIQYPANFTQFNDRMIVVGATTLPGQMNLTTEVTNRKKSNVWRYGMV